MPDPVTHSDAQSETEATIAVNSGAAFDYDLFVIGGGSGGVRAARTAAAEGASVALAEEFRLGGTCVIRGCVPKKLMVFASEYRHAFADARAYGWDAADGAFHWETFRPHLHAELTRLEEIYAKMLNGSGVEVHDQRAVITGPHEITLADATKKSAKHILIATGGRPVLPGNIENAHLGITSNEIFLLDELPKSMLVVGGGYIACEFACILNGLGVEVTQFYRGAQVLRGFDDEARALVAEQMTQSGVGLELNLNVVRMEKSGAGIAVTDTRGVERVFDQVLFATGRTANTEALGLQDVGVEVGPGGAVVVDAYSQTCVPSIFAIGDVTDRVQLTPVAIREAMAFVETVFKGTPTPVDHALIPSAIFTQPEMGTVGMSEEDAAALEPIEVYCTSFKPMQSAFARRADRVLMKLVVSRASRVVLGCHIVSPHAGEMIQLAGIAVKMGATKEQFDQTCAVHPTMSEELVTMRSPTRTRG